MQTNGAQLLRSLTGLRLTSGAGGIGQSSASTQAGGTTLDGATFQELLAKARAGDISSGISVRVDQQAGVDLSADQLARLGAAADLAEAHGASRGVFLIDGQAVMMDVGTRTVLGDATKLGAGVMTQVDAVINVPGAGEGGHGMNGQAPANASAANILSWRGFSPEIARALEGKQAS